MKCEKNGDRIFCKIMYQSKILSFIKHHIREYHTDGRKNRGKLGKFANVIMWKNFPVLQCFILKIVDGLGRVRI